MYMSLSEKTSNFGLKGGFQLMQILSLLGMYFDDAVVFIKNSSILFRSAESIIPCVYMNYMCTLLIFIGKLKPTIGMIAYRNNCALDFKRKTENFQSSNFM